MRTLAKLVQLGGLVIFIEHQVYRGSAQDGGPETEKPRELPEFVSILVRGEQIR